MLAYYFSSSFQPNVAPEYTRAKAAPSVATVRSDVCPSILWLFLPIVKLAVSKVLARSTNRISSPTAAVAGSVIVNAPPWVSANILSPAKAVYVVVFVNQSLPCVCISNQFVASVDKKTFLLGLITNVLPLPPSLAVIVLVVLAFLKKYNFSTAGNCTIKSLA